jgi:hypothetical protein
MDTPIHTFETECFVCSLRPFIVHPRVGSDLQAALHPRPLFRRPHQLSTNTSISERLMNKPALHETHGPHNIATIGMRPQSHLKEASECVIAIVGHKNRSRQCTAHAGAHDHTNLFAMDGHWSLRPKQLAHLRDRIQVRTLCLPDSRIRHTPRLGEGLIAITPVYFFFPVFTETTRTVGITTVRRIGTSPAPGSC